MNLSTLVRKPLCVSLRSALLTGVCLTAAVPAVPAIAANGTFLVQLNEYEGDSAYFAMYLVDPKGKYVRTLWVSGPDERWYPDQPRWWKYYGRAPQDLDAITGASTAPGDRSVIRINLEDEILDAGYKVRIDTSVEDQNNYTDDVEVALATDNMRDKHPGTGYVRYFRFKWDK